MQSCIFCKIISNEISAKLVAETDDLIVLNDIAPKAPTHQLIIPKKHVADIRELSVGDLPLGSKIFAMAQRLSKEQGDIPFRLLMNNGHSAGQRVMHIHVHFLAGASFAE